MYKRKIINEILKYISTDDVIVLQGARQVGKTCILLYLQDILKNENKLTYFIDLEDNRLLEILNNGHNQFIRLLKEEGFEINTNNYKNKIYVIIDEIQYLDNPSSFLKLIADHHREIKLIVSGSSSFNLKKKFSNSLVGRTVNFEIFNLSFEEFLLFKGVFFSREKEYTKKKISELIELYSEYVRYGGYPKIVLTSEFEMKEKYLQQIIDTYIKKDIRDLAAILDITKFNRLLEVIAPQSGQLLNISEIANTCRLNKNTVENYLYILEETYVIKMVRPFSRNLRSELFKTPKIFFLDTGLMQILWLKKLQKEILGSVFETSIFSELIKKYGLNKIFYWRTKDRREIDFIKNDANGILPIEVKLNFAQMKERSIKYFLEKYSLSDYKLVGLYGESRHKDSIFPWDL